MQTSASMVLRSSGVSAASSPRSASWSHSERAAAMPPNPTERSADDAVEGQLDIRELVRVHGDVDRLQQRQSCGLRLQYVLARPEAHLETPLAVRLHLRDAAPSFRTTKEPV